MTRVGTAVAAAVVTVAILAAGGIRARGATPQGPRAAALTATVTHLRETSSTLRRASTTSTVARVDAVTLPSPSTLPSTATSTSRPALLAAGRGKALEACLALATARHYQVVAANETWYRQQLRGLTARRVLASPQYRALLIEEAQAQTEIDAQYTIDQSNCYLA